MLSKCKIYIPALIALMLLSLPVLSQVSVAVPTPEGATVADGDAIGLMVAWAKYLAPIVLWLMVVMAVVVWIAKVAGAFMASGERSGMNAVFMNLGVGAVAVSVLVLAALYADTIITGLA